MKAKSKKSDLEGKRILFFEIGLIAALCIVITAFEWTTTSGFNNIVFNNDGFEVPTEIIPITKVEDITPPPPPDKILVPEIILIHEDDVDIEENTDVFAEPNETILPFIKPIIDEEDLDEPIPFLQIERKPTFMGGDYNTFNQWVAKNLKYPEEAARNGIQGRVYVRFTIDINGKVKDIEVQSKGDRLLEEEAVRVVSLSPPWTPGMQRDKPARVIFTFPVVFKLQ